MKRNFTKDNFEEFLRQNAEGLRMRPSEDVWKGISKQLKKERRTGGIALATVLLFLGTFSYLVVDNTGKLPTGRTAERIESLSGSEHTISATGPSNAITSPSTPSPSSALTLGSLTPGTKTASIGTESALSNADQSFASEFTPRPIDNDYPGRETSEEVKKTEATETVNSYPLSIESVVNTYRHSKRKKLTWQFYVTPTSSYRKLSENKAYLREQPDNSPAAIAATNSSVNSVVTHKPNLGLEVGFAAKYPIAKNIRLKAGLQLNVNRYDIKAYSQPTEVATIMFNGSSQPDSLMAPTLYSNTDGNRTDWLQNMYFQISVPVGIEFKLGGNDKIHFGVATTIQPTYILGDRAYLISTDYKNYAEVPELTRRWNVNTSLETFVGYNTGKVNWQVGPQIRYQLLSSFITKYPVKENLFDFGLRIGLSLDK